MNTGKPRNPGAAREELKTPALAHPLRSYPYRGREKLPRIERLPCLADHFPVSLRACFTTPPQEDAGRVE